MLCHVSFNSDKNCSDRTNSEKNNPVLDRASHAGVHHHHHTGVHEIKIKYGKHFVISITFDVL